MTAPHQPFASPLPSARLRVALGDLTHQHVDAIVNAANSSLLGGGGVDGAIHRAAGPALLAACRRLRETEWPQGLPTGEAVITPGGALPASYVIHTIGPVWHEHAAPEAARLLAACYRNAVALAARHGLATLAFPSISTGAFGYPREAAAPVVAGALTQALAAHSGIREVRLVFHREDDRDVFLHHSGAAADPD